MKWLAVFGRFQMKFMVGAVRFELTTPTPPV